MTDTDTEAPAVRPPRDYPFAEWQDTGDFAVSPSLRPFYADAEPSDLQKRGYIEYGVSIGEDVPVTRRRVAASGRDDGEPIVVEEPDTVTTLRDLRGAADYPRWLHICRTELAAAARQAARVRAERESRYWTCEVCGIRQAGVRSFSVRPDLSNDLPGALVVWGVRRTCRCWSGPPGPRSSRATRRVYFRTDATRERWPTSLWPNAWAVWTAHRERASASVPV